MRERLDVQLEEVGWGLPCRERNLGRNTYKSRYAFVAQPVVRRSLHERNRRFGPGKVSERPVPLPRQRAKIRTRPQDGPGREQAKDALAQALVLLRTRHLGPAILPLVRKPAQIDRRVLLAERCPGLPAVPATNAREAPPMTHLEVVRVLPPPWAAIRPKAKQTYITTPGAWPYHC